MPCLNLRRKSALTPISRNIVVVGDRTVGKTTLVCYKLKGTFIDRFLPTVMYFDSDTTLFCEGYNLTLDIKDTRDLEDVYDNHRRSCYGESDVILLTFSIGSLQSFENISKKWKPELINYCPNTPVVLVGCKADLRDDKSTMDSVSYQQGLDMATQIRAKAYLETSAKRRTGVDEAFYEAAKITLKKPSRCNIL